TAVGLPCGEALLGAGSPAGLRFEAARDRMLDAIGARRVRDRVIGITGAAKLSVALARDDVALVVDAVVLAIGGLVAGGVVYAPAAQAASAEWPALGKVPFELSLAANVALSGGGPEPMGIVASMQGPELDLSAWPVDGRATLVETIGVRCEGSRASERIYAA